MLDILLALARILVDIPYIAVSSDDNEESLFLDMQYVEQLYADLSDFDKHRLADYRQIFLAIVERQNDVHRDAVQLNIELVRFIGRELIHRSASGRSPGSATDIHGNGTPDDDGDWEGVEALQTELWRLACRMPRVVLAELVEFARGQIEIA